LLQAATQFRNRQSEIADTIAAVLGIPTQRDFDDVTRQLTELRRELRALERRLDASGEPGRGDA
jgi:phage terminase Nu1 subunit (DNA packaging protein)